MSAERIWRGDTVSFDQATERDQEVPGLRPGPSVLSRLISVDSSRFAADHWGRQPLLSQAADLPRPFTDLLNNDATDELVSSRGLRTPFLRVAKAGSTLSEKSFTAPGGVGAGVADQISDDKLVRLFADGSTLVLQALHRVWPPIIALCQELAAELGHPVQANAYVTPPQNQGFSDHYDVHDVFVLQIEGEKRWSVHAPVLESPLRDQPWTGRRSAVESRAEEPPLLETVLQPGDCLYLPRGFLHAAEALGGVSMHLTLGVHVWTRYAIAEQLVAQALETVAQQATARGSLPLGTTFTSADGIGADVAAVQDALIGAIAQLDVSSVATALQARVRGSSRAAPVGPLRQLRDASTLDPGSQVSLRKHLAASLEQLDGRVLLRSRAGELYLTEAEVSPARALLTGRTQRVGDLGVELARRLLLAGLAVLE